MGKGRRMQQKRGLSPSIVAAGAVLLAIIAAVAFVALRGGDDGGATLGDASGSKEYHPVSGFADVHGLAVNPEDPRELYVATHHGLIRGVNGADWARVGDLQHDLMGFSMHPTDGDIFWASGHPRGGGNIGVIHSTDGGFTWTRIALEGVDFHAMTVSPAEPDNLWGYYRGQLYRSTNGGHDWDIINRSPPRLSSLVADPREADTVYATTQQGIAKSEDGGETWSAWSDTPAIGLALDPTSPDHAYATVAGGIRKTTDGGETWTPLSLNAPQVQPTYLAMDPTNPSIVYAAGVHTETRGAGIYATTDGGETWTALKKP